MGGTGALAVGVALSPTWMRGDGWRRPDSRVEELFALPLFADLAREAEAVGADFLFQPDAGHLDPTVLDASPGFSTFDSTVLTAALAGITRRIGLVPTVQTGFAEPFTAARQLQSLHRISGGRAGWNVVTAIGGHRNFGADDPPPSPARYARAAEFVAAVHAVWESYPADALVLDRASGRFAGPGRVRAIDWSGEHFSIAGPDTVAADPAGPPPLFQAGASPAGVAFAGATADAVFGAARTVDDAVAQRTAVRAAAAAAGRDPDAVRFLPGLAFEVVDEAPSDPAERALHWTVRGTVDQVVAEVERWTEAGALDGFIALGGGGWTSVQRFLREVLPRLSTAGITRGAYRGTTLREHLRI